MRRFYLVALPFLAAFAAVFGLYHVYRAFLYVQYRQLIPAVMFGVFGLTGIGLAVAIWVARKRMRGSGQQPPA
ncbi:MAG TPA: hypothetical protein VM076_25750 [Gemmatimonadaceae bacterium]|nr:hypothetical protein [Gemmatimonadaceae bacterium]